MFLRQQKLLPHTRIDVVDTRERPCRYRYVSNWYNYKIIQAYIFVVVVVVFVFNIILYYVKIIIFKYNIFCLRRKYNFWKKFTRGKNSWKLYILRKWRKFLRKFVSRENCVYIWKTSSKCCAYKKCHKISTKFSISKNNILQLYNFCRKFESIFCIHMHYFSNSVSI